MSGDIDKEKSQIPNTKDGQNGNLENNQDDIKNTQNDNMENSQKGSENTEGLTKEESENLLNLFEQEYKKTKAMAEADGGLDNAEEDEIPADSDSVEEILNAPLLTGDELCVFCGVNPKEVSETEVSDACLACRAKLLKYPLPIKSFIAYFLVVLTVFLNIYLFAVIFPSSMQLAKADSLERKGDIAEASNIYFMLSDSQAQSQSFEQRYFVSPLRTTRKMIEILDVFGQPNSIPLAYEALPNFARALPGYRKLGIIKDKSEAFVEALQEAYAIIGDSMQLSGEDFPYDELVLSLDELLLNIESESQTYPENRKSAVLYYKYTAALLADKGLDAQIAPLEEISKLVPDNLWLYGRFLGYANARAGKSEEALEIANKMKKININDGYPYVIEATTLRMQKDFKGAIEVCDEGFAEGVGDFAEIARQKAIATLLDSKADKAISEFKDIANENQSLQNYYTLAICAIAAGDTETYDEIEELFENINDQQGIDKDDPSALKMGPSVLAYKNNEMSLEEIFLTGLADVF